MTRVIYLYNITRVNTRFTFKYPLLSENGLATKMGIESNRKRNGGRRKREKRVNPQEGYDTRE